MSTLTVATVKSNSSDPPAFQNTSGTEVGTLCRAWVNFNGTGTVAIRAQFNVSSITDNGTGDYTVNFTTAMVDANYSAQVLRSRGDANCKQGSSETGILASSVRVFSATAAASPGFEDALHVFVSVFR